MNILILVKLLVAHAVGDFFLQTDGICEGKKAKGSERMMYLGLHSLINAALAYILVADWVCWMIPVVIFISHFVIDLVKTSLDSEHVGIFIVDQLAHIAVLVGICAWMTDTDVTLTVKWAVDYRVWLVVLCYLLALKPSSILLGLFISKWTPTKNEQNSLPSAGTWIGYLERILILTFILLGCMEGIGFLLAAKSIFRFGELTKPREVKITEYVMIGTFSSFAIAIILGAFALAVIQGKI